jgi:hypothetical protein
MQNKHLPFLFEFFFAKTLDQLHSLLHLQCGFYITVQVEGRVMRFLFSAFFVQSEKEVLIGTAQNYTQFLEDLLHLFLRDLFSSLILGSSFD